MINVLLKTRHQFAWLLASSLVALCWLDAASVLGQDTEAIAGMRSSLESRVEASPNDSGAWRMLGRIYLKSHQEQEAFQAFERAVKLDPGSVAANYDFGRVLFVMGRQETATPYLKRVVENAPESDYAKQASDYLDELPDSEIEQVGFEVKRFDGSELAEQSEETLQQESETSNDWDFRLETGVLYNSNVALTPISRELSTGTRASFQGFLAPEVEYRMFKLGEWKAGPAFAGYFNVNEGNFSEYNLQNYQPAFFVERTTEFETFTLAPRIQYDYTHDEFDGETFGNRHALTTSASALWDSGDTSFVYWSINFTNFTADGLFPEIDSRDGWTNTLGLSHTIATNLRHLDSFRAGLDVESADTDGSDFRYSGVYLYGETETELREDLWLKLQLGWGYRDYPDFDLSPSRNENIYRTGVELRRQFTERCSLAFVFNYDRFDSKNPLFAAERFVGGVVTRYEY